MVWSKLSAARRRALIRAAHAQISTDWNLSRHLTAEGVTASVVGCEVGEVEQVLAEAAQRRTRDRKARPRPGREAIQKRTTP